LAEIKEFFTRLNNRAVWKGGQPFDQTKQAPQLVLRWIFDTIGENGPEK
jgi:hypothetical protein